MTARPFLNNFIALVGRHSAAPRGAVPKPGLASDSYSPVSPKLTYSLLGATAVLNGSRLALDKAAISPHSQLRLHPRGLSFFAATVAAAATAGATPPPPLPLVLLTRSLDFPRLTLASHWSAHWSVSSSVFRHLSHPPPHSYTYNSTANIRGLTR